MEMVSASESDWINTLHTEVEPARDVHATICMAVYNRAGPLDNRGYRGMVYIMFEFPRINFFCLEVSHKFVEQSDH